MSTFLKYLIIFGVAMVPIVELRGALPIAYGFYNSYDPSVDIGPNISLVWSYIVIAIGNMVPVPFIFFFARRILEWGKDKKVIGRFFTWCLKKGEKGGQKLQAKAKHGQYVALMLFVGIPLPGTGAWTGTLAASFLDMDFKKSVLSVIGGIVLASTIIGVLCILGFGAWFGITG